MDGAFTRPAHPLIDPSFVLAPANSVDICGKAWTDRLTGLYFSLSPDRSETINLARQNFVVTHEGRLPKRSLVRARIDRIDDRGGVLIYAVSRRRIFNEARDAAEAARRDLLVHSAALIDAADPDAHLPSELDRVTDRNVRERIIADLGGDDAFFALCLKAIRACHCTYRRNGNALRLEFTSRRVGDVQFVLTD